MGNDTIDSIEEHIRTKRREKGYDTAFIEEQFKRLLKKHNKNREQALRELLNVLSTSMNITKYPEQLSDFLKRDIPPVDYHVIPLFPKVGVSMVFGQPKSGKTKFMEYVMLKGERGEDIFDYYKVNKPFTVLWYDEENGEEDMHTDITCLCRGMDIPISSTKSSIFSFSGLRLKKEFSFWLEAHIYDKRPDMVVIDSVAKVMEGSENDVSDVRKLFQILGPLSNTYKILFVLIHHSPKDKLDMRGSGEFRGMINSGVSLQKMKYVPEDNGATRIKLTHEYSRQGREAPSINFLIRSDVDNDLNKPVTKRNLVFLGESKDVTEAFERNVVDMCMSDIKVFCSNNIQFEYTTADFIDAMAKRDYKNNAIYSAIKNLVDEKWLKKVKKGRYEIQ